MDTPNWLHYSPICWESLIFINGGIINIFEQIFPFGDQFLFSPWGMFLKVRSRISWVWGHHQLVLQENHFKMSPDQCYRQCVLAARAKGKIRTGRRVLKEAVPRASYTPAQGSFNLLGNILTFVEKGGHTLCSTFVAMKIRWNAEHGL